MRSRTLQAAVIVLSLIILFGLPLSSQTVTSKVTNNNWSDTVSWVGGIVPTATDTVIISARSYITIYSAGAACKVLIMKNDSLGASYFGITTGGVLTVGGGTGAVIMGNDLPSLTLDFWQYFYAGGTLNCGSLTIIGRRKTGHAGNIYFSVHDAQAVVNIAGNIIMDRDSSTSGNCVVLYGGPGIIHLGGTFSQVGFGGSLGMAHGTLDYNGTAGQTIAPFTYANLTLSGSGSKTMGGNAGVNDTLGLNGIELNTGGNTLTLGQSSRVTRTTGLVNGALKKVYADTGSFTFPSGTPGEYTPVSIHLTAGTPIYGFTVSAAHGTPAGVVDPTRALRHSWNIAPYGIVTSYDMVFTWMASDAPGTMNEANAGAGRSANPASFPWIEVGGTGNAVTHTGTITGQSGNFTWTWGEPGSLPIELGSFSAYAAAGRGIKLEWSTMSETNNLGFYVERRKNTSDEYTAVSGLVPGAGTTLEEHGYSWTDSTVDPGKYFYRLRQVNLDGRVFYSYEITVALDAVLAGRGAAAVPAEFALQQNYPNPFNPATQIRYQLPEESRVLIRIFDALGQELMTLVDETQNAGYRTAVWDARAFASGVYYCRLEAAAAGNPGRSFSEVRTMVLVK